jgi:hypothetical protein
MPRHGRSSIILGLLALAACGGDGPLEPVGGDFSLGQSLAVESGREARVLGGTTGGSFVAVVANIALDSTGKSTFLLRTSGIDGSGLPALSRSPIVAVNEGLPRRLERDDAFEDRLRTRERVELTPRFAAARRWNATSVPSLPVSVAVGDLVTVNVNAVDACTNPVYHTARVVALGTKALVLNDTLNPKPGFSTADFQRYAARFDTLVYPMDAAAFGEPTDIDRNGRIAIVFTRAVNELTPRGSASYVGGLTFSRDLFPQGGNSRAQPCASSNEGEYFYLMAPDPYGTINGNRRTSGFVDTATTGVIAHELQHLINASRKLYVNTSAPKFEEKWLDEGLAHIAEELLFYREAGITPRSNLSYASLTASYRINTDYNADMTGNAGRYRVYLASTMSSSPYRAGDSLSTRGAAWSLLRYLTDRAAASDGDLWFRLVNNSVTGTANLQSVFGNVAPLVRDWSVSQALDDVAVASAEFQQKSWNWHSIFAGGTDTTSAYTVSPSLYPLQVTAMTAATSYTGTVVSGGSAFYTFSVPANGTATLTLGDQSGAALSNLQLVIVRTK